MRLRLLPALVVAALALPTLHLAWRAATAAVPDPGATESSLSENRDGNGLFVDSTAWSKSPILGPDGQPVAVSVSATFTVTAASKLKALRLYRTVGGVLTLVDEASQANGRILASDTQATVTGSIPLSTAGVLLRREFDSGVVVDQDSIGDVP